MRKKLNHLKLKVKRFPSYGEEEEICDFEAAQYWRFGMQESGTVVFVEGERVCSYQEFCRVALQHADKEFISVYIVAPVGGGCPEVLVSP